MDYDHSRNAGNQADLVKHVALVAALTHLLEVHSVGLTFVYGDLHCGRPQYVLRDRGGWREGVLLFAEHPAIIAARRQGDARPAVRTLLLEQFDALLGHQPLSAGAIYLGSAGIVFRMLRQANVAFEMQLWDSNRFIADELIRYFSPWPSLVSVRCNDGYQFNDTTPFSLVLVDPVELEVGPTLQIMERMTRNGIPFLCWTPRRSVGGNTPPGNSMEWVESAESQAFPHQAVRYGTCVAVQWASWGATTPGCYLTASSAISAVTVEAVDQLCGLLGWRCVTG